jgi:hypothetical protein
MKRGTGGIVINNRPLKQLHLVVKQIPRNVWVLIFQHIIVYDKYHLDFVYNCRFICKSFAKMLESPKLWQPLINQHDLGFFPDLRHDKSLLPLTYLAQITFRNYHEDKLTHVLLKKWFFKKRFKLLFQTLSPITYIIHGKYMRNILGAVNAFKLHSFWGEYHCGVICKNHLFISDHFDQLRVIFDNVKRDLITDGRCITINVNELQSKYIKIGFQLMLGLWKFKPRNKKGSTLFKEIMNKEVYHF